MHTPTSTMNIQTRNTHQLFILQRCTSTPNIHQLLTLNIHSQYTPNNPLPIYVDGACQIHSTHAAHMHQPLRPNTCSRCTANMFMAKLTILLSCHRLSHPCLFSPLTTHVHTENILPNSLQHTHAQVHMHS